MSDNELCLQEIGKRIMDKDLLILSDKLRRLTPSQVRTVEAIIDECNNLLLYALLFLRIMQKSDSFLLPSLYFG